jgi:hypothetical protein
MKLLNQEFEGVGVQMRFNCDYVDMPVDEEMDDDIDYIEDEDGDDYEGVKEETKIPDDIKGLKELKEKKYTIKELIAKVKLLYPNMKGITTKKKEELLKLLNSKEEIKEEKIKPKIKITKSKEELKKEIINKYPNYKIKTTATKEDLIKILELSPEEVEKLNIKKGKKKGGFIGNSGDSSSTSSSSYSGGEGDEEDEEDEDEEGEEEGDGDGDGDEEEEEKVVEEEPEVVEEKVVEEEPEVVEEKEEKVVKEEEPGEEEGKGGNGDIKIINI